MKYFHRLVLLVLSSHFLTNTLPAQSSATLPYFQQAVDYTIAVTLDDVQHSISGNIEIVYTNHSPDTLRVIWMHLWGNAFQDRRSAFCRQKLRDGNGRYYFAKKQDLGQYKSLDFKANGEKISWKFDVNNPDIALLELPKPLFPGASVRLSTPLELKIPASFSRLGHVATSYQMTQWYPKPAVYDHLGWHAMPYLDQGEFYSEFGNFDVSLTLPENYVVGATGTLQTPSEWTFLKTKEAESRERLRHDAQKMPDDYPKSAEKMKTIRYTAEQVHDFAWFADKRFMVLKDTARLASGKTVECWALFTNAQAKIWQKGAFYVRRSVEFYSENVGEYPWPQATAVHSALSAGGGMEYPMITVIGNSGSARDLDDVITHEVGHNWFYGILASNERDHPFMDEGLNSYYEGRYMRKYYTGYTPYELPKKLYDPAELGSLLENGYLMLARDDKDTPPDSHSATFSPVAYGLQVYMKTALCLQWLEKAVGTDRFDDAMKAYYQQWKFKHPYPEDLKKALDSKGLPVNWFFEAMQTQKRADYAIKGIKKLENDDWELTIQQKGALAAPFPVSAISGGKLIKTEWFDAFLQDQPGVQKARTQKLHFNAPNADAFVIDQERDILDLNRKNNARRTRGAFPGMEPWQLKMLSPFQNARRNTIGLMPWVGWNNSDKTMLGLILYNPPFPSRKLQVYLFPGIGLGSKRVVGMADVRYRLYPGGFFKKLILGFGAKTFDAGYNTANDSYTRFYRVVPQIRAELRSASNSFSHVLNFRTLLIGEEQEQVDSTGSFGDKSWRNSTIHELRYEGEQRALPHPYRFQVALETQDFKDALGQSGNYWRITASWRQQFYFRPKKKVTMRLFAGYFLKNTARNSSITPPYNAISLNPQGFNDYKYDQIFLARAGAGGILGRQVSQTEGGFKGAFGSAFAGTLGNSNSFALALNLKTDLPFRLPLRLPLKPYFDLGYFEDATPLGEGRPKEEQLLWNGGLMLEFFKGGLEVYFPLFSSKTLQRQYCEQGGGTGSGMFCGGDYLKMISWSMRVNMADPLELIQSFLR